MTRTGGHSRVHTLPTVGRPGMQAVRLCCATVLYAREAAMVIGLGIIGCGVIGGVHAAAARRAGSAVAACFDVDQQRAQEFAGQHGAVHCASLDALLGHADVRAVVIATPNDTHCELALRALAAGRDVLLEKPMALRVGECQHILDTAQQLSRIVQLSFVCRQSPTALLAKSFIDAGRLGRMYHARAMLFRRRGIPGLGRWFTTAQHSGGGVLIDIGVHVIDLLLHLSGSPTPLRISGQTASLFGRPIEQYRFTDMWAGPPQLDGVFDVDDHATATLRCDGDLTFDIAVSWASNIPEIAMNEGITILGDRGGLFLHLWDGRITLTTETDGVLGDFTADVPAASAWDSAWQRQHELFAEAITQRTAPPAGAMDGLIAQAIVEAWYESSRQQREVEVQMPASNRPCSERLIAAHQTVGASRSSV
jgi:predicted dehydrogenase